MNAPPLPDNEALEEEIPWAQAPVEARKRQLGKLFVQRGIQQDIFDIIDSARAERLNCVEAQLVAIIGETGVGKTEIAKRYLAANRERIDPTTGKVIRPVFYVDVRHSSTPKSLAKAMTRALLRRGGIEPDDPEDVSIDSDQEDADKDVYSHFSTADMTQMLKKLIVGERVEVVFLDEFYNTITDNGPVRINRIANWVRDFAKSKERTARRPDGRPEENIVLVLIGTKKVKNIIDPTVNPELASITPYRCEIDRYRYRNAAEKREFRQFLNDLDYELPFDEDSNLGRATLADKIYLATFGLLRQLGQIITKAGELAVDDGSPNIFEHHLHRAVEVKRGVLEAALMSDESKGSERREVENPFTQPQLPDAREQRRRGGYRQ